MLLLKKRQDNRFCSQSTKLPESLVDQVVQGISSQLFSCNLVWVLTSSSLHPPHSLPLGFPFSARERFKVFFFFLEPCFFSGISCFGLLCNDVRVKLLSIVMFGFRASDLCMVGFFFLLLQYYLQIQWKKMRCQFFCKTVCQVEDSFLRKDFWICF